MFQVSPHEPHLRASDTASETTIPPETRHPLVELAHIISGLWGVTGGANTHSIFLTLLLAKMVADNCPLCSQTKLWKAPRWGHMPLGDRPYSFGSRFLSQGHCPFLELVGTKPLWWVISLDLHWPLPPETLLPVISSPSSAGMCSSSLAIVESYQGAILLPKLFSHILLLANIDPERGISRNFHLAY